MPTQHQPNAAMKIAVAVLAVLLTASPGHSSEIFARAIQPKEAAQPQQKVILLERISSSCLLGDECPETRTEKDEFGQLKGKPRVLPALLSLGWRVVSFTPVHAEEPYTKNPAEFPSSYLLLEKK
ncbi:hypothetical protein [Candidatus Electronema sp. JM]|uniref:hypothetical protein n=1 Tax=Candidatus Electronema sp. JM TaxID=3401571 RepID=UPI003AA94491